MGHYKDTAAAAVLVRSHSIQDILVSVFLFHCCRSNPSFLAPSSGAKCVANFGEIHTQQMLYLDQVELFMKCVHAKWLHVQLVRGERL